MSKPEITFDAASQLLESTLNGSLRHEIIDDLSSLTDFREALLRLRTGMRTNNFKLANSSLNLDRIIKVMDKRTREDGFHALNDWDGKADKLNPDIIPIDVVDFFVPATSRPPYPAIGLAILLDYYFMYVLGMFCLRAWDAENVELSFGHMARLLDELQGPHGSGQRFIGNVETLILVATSHFEPDHSAYTRLLEKVRHLPAANQMRIALAHAGILGSHLRYGFEPFYKRDLALMRDDNVPDYAWMTFSLITLMRAYAALHDSGGQSDERSKLVEGIFNVLTPDTRAFLGKAPASLAPYEAELAEFRTLFGKYRDDLIAEFEEHRPSPHEYSPLAFNFNFPHNIAKAIAVSAVAHGEASTTTLTDLLTGLPRHLEGTREKYVLMNRLMEFARLSPETIRGRSFPMLIYDPLLALRNYTKALSLIKELTGPPSSSAPSSSQLSSQPSE